jgi:hypothetical protein
MPNKKTKPKPTPLQAFRLKRSTKGTSVASRHPFQDHLVLETKSDFSIILRLENAVDRIAENACHSP